MRYILSLALLLLPIKSFAYSFSEFADDTWGLLGDAFGIAGSATLRGALELFNFAANALPESSGLPAQVTTASSLLGSKLSLLNYFVPVDTIANMIYFFVMIQLALVVYKLSLRLIGLLRGTDVGANVDVSMGGAGIGSSKPWSASNVTDTMQSRISKRM